MNGEEGWYPLVSWGNHWYESDRQFEVLLGDTEDIETVSYTHLDVYKRQVYDIQIQYK